MDTLTPQELESRLADLDGWSLQDDAIHKQFEFDSYMDAIAFINAVAAKAEAANHHPDLHNSYTTVNVSLTTHSEGGVTTKDLDLAREIDSVEPGSA